METPRILLENPQTQYPTKAGLNSDPTGVPDPEPDSFWKKLQQFCQTGSSIDSFDAYSFDEDAKPLDDDAASSSCSSEKGFF